MLDYHTAILPYLGQAQGNLGLPQPTNIQLPDPYSVNAYDQIPIQDIDVPMDRPIFPVATPEAFEQIRQDKVQQTYSDPYLGANIGVPDSQPVVEVDLTQPQPPQLPEVVDMTSQLSPQDMELFNTAAGGAAQAAQEGGAEGLMSFLANNEGMMKGLLLGLNAISFQPDPNLADMLLAGESAKRKTESNNRTVEYLRSLGRDDLAQLAAQYPGKAFEIVKMAQGTGTPAALQEFDRMTEGMTPEQVEKARRIKLGLDPRAGSQFALGLEDIFKRKAAERGGAISAETEAEQKATTKANANAWELWQQGTGNLERALTGTETGFFVGMLPAISSNQQMADAAVAQMLPMLKQVFRSSGEGVFTDKDQEVLEGMIPNRGANPEVIASTIEQINRIVSLKLGQEYTPPQKTDDVLLQADKIIGIGG